MASEAGGIGGGGGGKIRTRRCHQGPIKPYQQGRPKQQVRGPDPLVVLRVGNLAGGNRRPGALAPHVGRTGGPEERPGRGSGSGSPGRWGGGGKWAETGRSSPRTRVVRAASSQPSRAGASPAGAWREQTL